MIEFSPVCINRHFFPGYIAKHEQKNKGLYFHFIKI